MSKDAKRKELERIRDAHEINQIQGGVGGLIRAINEVKQSIGAIRIMGGLEKEKREHEERLKVFEARKNGLQEKLSRKKMAFWRKYK